MSAVLARMGGGEWGMEQSRQHSLRKATQFEDISEILGRMALERQKKCDELKKNSPSPAMETDSIIAALQQQKASQDQRIRDLERKLLEAERMLLQKDTLIKMLEAENKHLGSVVDEVEKEHIKDVYESAPQKRTSKRPGIYDSKMLRSLRDNNVAPITVRMPDNEKLGWAVSKNGVIMHRIMVEFSATLSQLDGKRMMLKWSVLRRYSAFEKLVKDLGIVGLENIPSLPPKSWFRVDPRRRQAQLHTFLCKLLLVPGILSLPPLRKFLNITSEMASMLPGGSNRAGKKKRGRS